MTSDGEQGTSFFRHSTVIMIGLAALAPVSSKAAPAPVTVPFRLVGPSSPIVTIRIQDREASLELDIGNGSSLALHPGLIRELSATPTGESDRSYGMEGKKIEVPVLKVDHVEMGGVVLRDVLIHEDGHDDEFRARQMAERGTQGYIGAGFFKGYELVLDYRRRQITLIPPESQPEAQRDCSGRIVPLEDSVNWGLVSRVDAGQGDMLFVWDTGTPGLLIVKANAQAVHVDTAHGPVTFEHFRMNGHEFGPLRFDVIDFAAPPGMVGMIGYDFFSDHVTCIDFPHNRILVR